MFGFLDQEAAFSAAFVFIIAHALSATDRNAAGIRQACHILRHLANHGNKAALRLADEVLQMCDKLSIPLNFPSRLDSGLAGEDSSFHRPTTAANHSLAAIVSGNQQPTTESSAAFGHNADENQTTGAVNPEIRSSQWLDQTSSTVDFADNDGESLFLTHNALWNSDMDVFSQYRDFDLTGVDLTDWETLDNQIFI